MEQVTAAGRVPPCLRSRVLFFFSGNHHYITQMGHVMSHQITSLYRRDCIVLYLPEVKKGDKKA